MNTTPEKAAAQVVQLPTLKRLQATQPTQRRNRFALQKFINRGGSESWRVSGRTRQGVRIRENFVDERAAEMRRTELEVEYLNGDTATVMRSTKLSHEQLQLAEAAIGRLGDDWLKLLDAVNHWVKTGQQAATTDQTVKLDAAVTAYVAWLDSPACTLRPASKMAPKSRLPIFSANSANVRLGAINADFVDRFLTGLTKVSAVTRDNYKRDISGFFAWCMERPRQWIATNPCRDVKVAKPEKPAPAILDVEQCEKLLRAAEGAKLAAYVAVALFAGLRPFEITRLKWEAVNLDDREIRLEGVHTKTGRARVVAICDTLHAWLVAYKDQPFFPSGWHKRFRAVKKAAGITTWPVDVMRHTAVSHFFRKTGSYGLTAEQFGNSEAIIKMHYAARTSTADTEKFFALRPAKSGKAKGRTAKKK